MLDLYSSIYTYVHNKIHYVPCGDTTKSDKTYIKYDVYTQNCCSMGSFQIKKGHYT